jgi:hypothetical protein
MRYFIALILIWMCRQAITDNEVDVPAVRDPYCTLTEYNTTQVNLGRAFFRQLIDDIDSFKHVNEHNVCALIHFFIREAAHNGQPIQFSSG